MKNNYFLIQACTIALHIHTVYIPDPSVDAKTAYTKLSSYCMCIFIYTLIFAKINL